VSIAALPDDFEFPSELRDVINYDGLTHELKASRSITPPERTLLQDVANTAPADFTEEVEELFALQDGLQDEIRFDAEVGRL
jgi:hypothetical protein